MNGKANWIVILILVILTVSFFIGLSGGMQGYDYLGWGMLGIGVAILIGFILGVFAIVHLKRTMGTKGIFIGILILLVLIPLVFAGTCAISVGGDFVRRLFFK